MTNPMIVLIALALVASPAAAQTRSQSFRDADGRYAGSATTTREGMTSYRDASGRYAGHSVRTGTGTSYFGADGSYRGSTLDTTPQRQRGR